MLYKLVVLNILVNKITKKNQHKIILINSF